MLVLLGVGLLCGAGTALSPCALPVLPALLAAGAGGGRRRPVGVVAGLSVTFALAIIGGGELLRHVGLGGGTLRHLGIAVLVVAGLAALIPAAAARLERPLVALSRYGPAGFRGDGFGSGLLVGGALGFVYAPCAGPVLAAVVSVSAATGRTVALAVAYVAGTALALLAIALGGRRVLDPLRRAGGAARVQQALGAVMLVTAVLFAVGLDMRFETALARHTSSLELTAGLEQSGGVQKRLRSLHHRRARFEEAASTPAPLLHPGPRAKLPDLGVAPEFTGTQKWFNSRPLSLAALRGRVVLVDFWTYTCINCLRTLPYLEAWDRRYRDAGLTIVGVHAPEFGFEHDAGNVARAIATNGIKYPVVQDNNLATWNAWGNQYWPAEYLIDARGHVRAAHFGEGDYDKTEAHIRALLAERGARVGHGMAQPEDVTPVSRQTTPETYVGTARAERFAGDAPQAGVHFYGAPPDRSPMLSHFQLGGTWNIADEAATAVKDATLTATVQARFVYLVLSPPHGGRGGVDVRLDGGAPKHVVVDTQRLYTLVALPRAGRHRLDLALAPGTSAFAFTFG
jgi:cytochrome c biogenesis protein CcdA/thiol-disulfide isomerase/thioredoxin